ncbi:reverse transcriptase [Tanacetum coccineum]
MKYSGCSHPKLWRACFIYGPHIREDRVALWNRISSLVKLSMCPFIVIGDFIIIRSARDKQGGSIYTSRSVDEFQAFLSASELFEIPYKELSYTWDNKRDVGAKIMIELIEALTVMIYRNFPVPFPKQSSSYFDSEITRAIKQLGAYKAPDEDGFPGLFFHKYWHIVGTSVCNAVRQFFIRNSMIVANEAFHYIRGEKSGDQRIMALKLDLNKAFDRVEWNFLIVTLRKMGFGEKWCNWIFSCISSYELEFFINGESIGSIRPSRGLRQENVHECKILVDILDRYCKASGQSIKFTKSAALFSPNSSKFLQEQICELLNVACMDPKARYIGLPSICGRNKGNLFSFILEKVLQKVQGWKKKLLSQAGREILIKSVIQALPSYAMQCYLLPNGLLEKILCHIRRFFWSREIDKRRIHWLS